MLALDESSKSLDPLAIYLPTEAAVTPLATGTQVGPYVLEAQIGKGGMGVVYRALDTRLGRQVAVKFLSTDVADAAGRRRFQREAQMASSLNHPHILTVHDAGEFEGREYLVTEFVDGGTLRDWATRERRSWRQVVELLTGIADGLAAAHEAHILHRDIKPANILVATNGYAKLADFGLARLTEDRAEVREDEDTRTLTERQTHPGMIIGTISYMSPEQASGQRLDARSDIFSFGVVLYELLAGQRPFAGATDLETLQTIIHGSPKPLSEKIPPTLKGVVEKALEKDPAARYQSMREMVVDLRRLTRQVPPQPSSAKSGWKWAGAAAVVLTAACVAWLRLHSATDPTRLEYTRLTDFADSAVSPTLSPDGRFLAFIRGADTFKGLGDVYVKQLPDGEPVQLTHDGQPKEGPVVFSPDGTRLAYAIPEETWTVPVLGGEPTRLMARSSGLSWVEPAPGQLRVMFSSLTGEGIHMGVYTSTESRGEQRTVYLPRSLNAMAHRSYLSPDHKSVIAVEMDMGSWRPCQLVPFDGSSKGKGVGPNPAQCTDGAWSPDGKWMYLSANTGDGFHIWRQRFPDGTPERLTSGATEEQGVGFAPDGRSFVTSVGSRDSTIWIHDSRGDRQITSEGFAYMPSFSADGTKLYYLERLRANQRFVSGGLWAVDLASGKRERLMPDVLIEQYSVSADGRRVVFLKLDDSGHSPVWIAPLDGSAPPRLLSALDSDRVLFSPSDDIWFVGDEGGTKYLYRVKEDGSGLRKVLPDPMLFLYAISPDGESFAAWEAKTSSVAIYSTDGKSRTFLCSHCGSAGDENRGVTPPMVQWSRDSKFVYLHSPHSTSTGQTYIVPLPAGQLAPALPGSGPVNWVTDLETLPGARLFPQQRAFGGPDPSVYAYPRVTTHRNIYRISVP